MGGVRAGCVQAGRGGPSSRCWCWCWERSRLAPPVRAGLRERPFLRVRLPSRDRLETALKLPPLIASRYVPVRLIGKGGMGAVYEVEHARTGEHLALKVLLSGLVPSAEALERFKREARASARIRSEHVVRVTDADVAPELEGAPFLVMELLEGMDLEQAAAASPPSPASVVAWLRQVAQAIDKAHALGIIHRDLKPENLFLAKVEGRRSIVKVLDFGIAKMLEEGTGVTGSGQMLGTPKYMSPEQATPNAPVTPATDRCALGLIAYRLLVGESYYKGGAMAILGQILHGELQPPSACGSRMGDAFDAWFLKACHRNPERRFSSGSEQVEALAGALGLPRADGGGDATLAGAALRAASRDLAIAGSRPRRPLVIAGVVAAGLVAVALVGLLAHRSGGAGGSRAMPTAAVPSSSGPLASSGPSPPPVRPATSVPSVPSFPSVPSVPFVPSAQAAAPIAQPDAPWLGAPEAQVPARSPDRPRALRRRVADASSAIGALPATLKEGPGPTAPGPVPDPYAEQK